MPCDRKPRQGGTAEPVSVRYAQGQVHHTGRFGKLEDQLCPFSAAGYLGGGSPDHADAAIWALTHLFGADATGRGLSNSIAARQ